MAQNPSGTDPSTAIHTSPLKRTDQDLAEADLRLKYLATSAMIFLSIVAAFVTLFLGKEIFIPIAAAIVLNLLLGPIHRGMRRLFFPAPLAAGLIVMGIIAAAALLFYFLSAPAAKWVDQMPRIALELQYKLDSVKRPLESVQEASEQIEQVTDMAGGASKEKSVVVRNPSLIERFFGNFTKFLVQFTIVIILLYFLLASDGLFKVKLIKVIPRLRDKKRAVEIARQAERQVSNYLLTITAINAALGAAVGGVFYVLELPNALLWGVMAAFLNYIPYLGPFAGVIVITVVSLLSFDSLSSAIMPPLVYFFVNAIEAQLITPSILGRRLTMNPVVIFGTVVFWGWLWGIAGGLLAVPILIALKVICNNVDALQPLGEFLNRKESEAASN